MLVDLAQIHVIAGSGGNGCVSFRREKYVPKGGPDGGDGGRGGSVKLLVDPHVRTLLDCREQPRYRADSGRPGEGNRRSGKDGRDLLVRVPTGTLVKDPATGEVMADLVREGDEFVAARGGGGGRGNARFATSTHQTPRRADPGEPGEERRLELELKLIADVGLVGLPNAGKSTLLSRISRARPKIAAYPFTTLEPNLGIASLDGERQFVVADVPGLIEGAHAGRGLGVQFLRHLERTRVLIFMVDATGESPVGDCAVLEREMALYGGSFERKPRIVVLTKGDLLPPESRAGAARDAGLPDARLISAQSGEGLRAMLEELWTLVAPASSEAAPKDATHGG
ncbi:MAG: GTPase ObgE [Candidatus Eisenbacteria bacterium]|nr:GTPase ObgE [Candidatus Eisenbacteria bacterium]